MSSQLFILRTSLLTSLVIFCAFSIVYLASRSWSSNRWLVLIFFVHLWVGLAFVVSSEGFAVVPDNPFLVNYAPLFLFTPALYFYAYDLIKPNRFSFADRLPHFIPFLIFYTAAVVIGWREPVATLLRESNAYFMITFIIANLTVTLIYGYLTLQLVNYNQHKYQEKYAMSSTYLSLDWLRWLVYFLIALPFQGAISNLAFKTFAIEGEVLVVVVSMLLAMLILAYFTFRQPRLYPEEQAEVERQNRKKTNLFTPTEEKESQALIVTNAEMAGYISKLEAYLEQKKPYLNPRLRMPEMAEALDIPRHVFSHVINEHYGMNFFNLINQYRVKYAQTLLRDGAYERYTLEAIGEMAGFNSRSTFNRRFKEIVGRSPKAFKIITD